MVAASARCGHATYEAVANLFGPVESLSRAWISAIIGSAIMYGNWDTPGVLAPLVVAASTDKDAVGECDIASIAKYIAEGADKQPRWFGVPVRWKSDGVVDINWLESHVAGVIFERNVLPPLAVGIVFTADSDALRFATPWPTVDDDGPELITRTSKYKISIVLSSNDRPQRAKIGGNAGLVVALRSFLASLMSPGDPDDALNQLDDDEMRIDVDYITLLDRYQKLLPNSGDIIRSYRKHLADNGITGANSHGIDPEDVPMFPGDSDSDSDY